MRILKHLSNQLISHRPIYSCHTSFLQRVQTFNCKPQTSCRARDWKLSTLVINTVTSHFPAPRFVSNYDI